MALLDLIQELREGKPDSGKAARFMAGLGVIMIISGALFFIISRSEPEDALFSNTNISYWLTGQASLAVLCLISAWGIHKKTKWGKIITQISIMLFLPLAIAPVLMIYPGKTAIDHGVIASLSFSLVAILAIYGPIAYYGIKYINRLPVESTFSRLGYTTYQEITSSVERGPGTFERVSPDLYHHCVFPFGVYATFALFIFALMLMILLVTIVPTKPELIFPFFVTCFASLFLAPALYNRRISIFQKNRELVASFTGGGSVYLFNGSWPFFRLLVYKDGLEVRVFFHCYFISYDKMANIPKKAGFFTFGLLIKSDLPGVPSRIRFHGFSTKKLLATVNTCRNDYLAGKTGAV